SPIFLAISERVWSTTIRYPCQSFEVWPPHRGHTSSSEMKKHFLHAFGTFTAIGSLPPLRAALRAGAVLLDPLVLPEGGLAHREPDLRLPRRALVQAHRDDPDPDLEIGRASCRERAESTA